MEEGDHKWEEPQDLQHHLGPDCGLVEWISFDRNKARDGLPSKSITGMHLVQTASSSPKASFQRLKEQMHMIVVTLLSCYGKLVIAAPILGHLIT